MIYHTWNLAKSGLKFFPLIKFTKKEKDIFLIGSLTHIKNELSKNFNNNSNQHVNSLLNDYKSGNDGTVISTLYTTDVGTYKRITLCVTCDDQSIPSRYLTSSRADLITKNLMKKFDSSDILICADDKDIVPLTMALTKCVPVFCMKKKENEKNENVRVFLPSSEEKMIHSIQNISDSVRIAQMLVDMPPSVLDPLTFSVFVKEMVKDLPNTTFEEISGEELLKKGYEGIHAVGRAAIEAPRLIILKHTPINSNDQKHVLIGKGITYDAGGLSIKPTSGMCGMKRDMGGSAGCFGAFYASVKSNELNNPLYCVLCVAENSVAGNSYRNDDILKMYSGVTVEVNNTDAEGRLALADGAAHSAKHFNLSKNDVVIDMATLTGAQGVATGEMHASIVSNDESLEKSAVVAGKESGDLTHPLMFLPEVHMNDFKSEVADMKNTQKTRTNCGSASAGIFVWKHLTSAGFEGKWLHIDMAYPSHIGERATGYGVALLCKILKVF